LWDHDIREIGLLVLSNIQKRKPTKLPSKWFTGFLSLNLYAFLTLRVSTSPPPTPRARRASTALINFVSFTISAAASKLHMALTRIHGDGPCGNFENSGNKAKSRMSQRALMVAVLCYTQQRHMLLMACPCIYISCIKRHGIGKIMGYHVTGFLCSVSELNSVAWVRERTTPTERSPIVGEVSANFFG
jgi:hypothetical protein